MRTPLLDRAARQILWGMLVILVATIPALEFACHGTVGEAHEQHHVHASPVLAVDQIGPVFISVPGPAVLFTPVLRVAGASDLPFVPPRL
jgi:hypothetical protein